MIGFIKKMFAGLLSFSASLASIANVSKFTICIFLDNKSCMTRPTLINLNPDEYNQGFCYYSLMVSLDRRNGSCNTLDDPSNKICALNKTKDLN